MCVVSAKWLPSTGWILAKNRDRNYKPLIRIRKSFRNDMERLYIWDERTKYTEGINEYGVAILSASVAVKKDEEEGAKAVRDAKKSSKKTKIANRIYYAPDGKRIRTALFEKTAVDATKKLVELQISGNTVVADRNRCFILEGAYTKDDQFVYKIKEVSKDEVLVRTNHGILLPWTGYSAEIESQVKSRKSSEIRLKTVHQALLDAQTFEDVVSALSSTDNDDPQMNPMRIDIVRRAMRTTGQIFLVPSENTMHYRPVWSDISFDINKLNNNKEKTFFEVVSARKLITFSKYSKK